MTESMGAYVASGIEKFQHLWTAEWEMEVHVDASRQRDAITQSESHVIRVLRTSNQRCFANNTAHCRVSSQITIAIEHTAPRRQPRAESTPDVCIAISQKDYEDDDASPTAAADAHRSARLCPGLLLSR
jgi:hypothetical protein